MKNEKLIKNITSQAVNIVGGKMDALRCNSDQTTTIRAYDNGFIGVAGQIGKADEKDLYEKAVKNLSQDIPYPCKMQNGIKRHENHKNIIIARGDLIKTVEKLVEKLNKKFPHFCFDGKLQLNGREHTYTNSEGADYYYSNNTLTVSFAMRDKRLANIMDLAYGTECESYNEEKIISDISAYIDAYENKVSMPAENLPIIIGSVSSGITQYLINHIIAERYMGGASIFKDKLNTKLFGEKFSISADRAYNPETTVPFFDDEGTVLDGDKFEFVKNGIFAGLLATNRSSGLFNIPSSGTSESSFDSVPSFGLRGFKIPKTHDSLKSLAKKAIFVAITSGGDMTPDGKLGLPVQLAYIYENGKLTARLPEFSLSGSIYDVFGDKLLGVAEADFEELDSEELLVTELDIAR